MQILLFLKRREREMARFYPRSKIEREGEVGERDN
jgi:hypothetical protein